MSQPRRSGIYYIIEHPTRGIIREIEVKAGKSIPHYSTTMRRNNPKIVRFTELQEATKTCTELVRFDVPGARILDVRRAPDFKARCWECGGWIDTKYGRETGHRSGCPRIGGGD